MKQLVLVLMMLAAKVAVAQAGQIPKNIRSAFEGTWVRKEKHHTNSVAIRFEEGKDYALFTDIGTGVAPSRTFKVQLKENRLLLPAALNRNDYMEMKIVDGELYLKVIPVQWDASGKLIGLDKDQMERRVFKKVRK